MNNLVGYGVSSDSESDGEGGNTSKGLMQGTGQGEEGATQVKCRNFLLECGSASSGSSSDQEDENEDSGETHTDPSGPASNSPPVSPAPNSLSTASYKLPPPPLGGICGGGVRADSSVFANPFKERAEEQLSVLQKHVPLTLQARPSQIGGKRICVTYRKDGRCRFGSRCKFAHDSDLQNIALAPGDEVAPGVGQDQANQNESGIVNSQSQGGMDQGFNGEGGEGGAGRKRRVGLSEGLTPPKRALKQYTMQRERESVMPS